MCCECGSPSSSSLRHMIKSSICCFRSPPNEQEEPLDYNCRYRHLRTPKSPACSCRKTRSHETLDVKDGRCRSLFARIGAGNRNRSHSADFRYDPLSYALNFEDGVSREDEFPVSFSSRLPTSPDRSSEAAMPREIVACS